MATASNLLIGPVQVEIGGTNIGFTTEDGVDLEMSFEIAKFRGAQSQMTVHSHRFAGDGTIKLTCAELTLANLGWMYDLAAAASGGTLNVDLKSNLTTRAVVLMGAGPSGGTRTFYANAKIESVGAVKAANNEYSTAEVTMTIMGDASNERLGTFVDSDGDNAAPAPASYQKVAGGTVTGGYLAGGTPTTITDAETGVAVTSVLQVTFNVDLRLSMLDASKIMLLAVGANTPIAATFLNGETSSARDFKKLIIKPDASLAGTTVYNLIIPAGIVSAEGVPSTTGYAIQFTTS